MCSANERYWQKEIGKEVTCKCGRVHLKERRPKSSTCKPCLAERAEKALSIQIAKAKKEVLAMIGVKQCPRCEIIKPYSEYYKKNNRGECKACDNRRQRNKWRNSKAYRIKRIKQNLEHYHNSESRKHYQREWRKDNAWKYNALPRYNIGACSYVNIVKCADCGENEVRRSTKHVRCLCTSCYDKRRSRDFHYKYALYNNGKRGGIVSKCKGGCGNAYVFAYGSKSRMCEPCKLSSKRRQKQAHRARRRAGRVAGVSYDPHKVFRRDKWRCYLCGVKTQKKDIYADNAAEIDHVIPLSKGGKDIPSNVRCSCRKCNQEKSDNIIPVTGNLFCQTG